jgi:predicted  nucleic acid-binding Zn-ribbon protein
LDIQPEILKQSIESLLKLQEIDGQIFKLRSQIDKLPPDLLERKTQVENADKMLKILEKAHRDAERERRSLELRSLTLSEDLKRAENKQREVRNTKEEFSAGRELDTFRKKLAEVKAALEQKTQLATDKLSKKDEQSATLATMQAELDQLMKAREETVVQSQQDLAVILKRRDEYIAQVDETIFSMYERVQKLRRGSGVALVKDDVCQGCFVSVPPTTRLALERLQGLVTCSSCSRILYLAEFAEELAAS